MVSPPCSLHPGSPILLAWAPAPRGRLGTRLLQRSFHPGWFLQGHHAVCNLFSPKFVTGSPSCKPLPGKKFPPEPRPWGHFHNAISIVPFPYKQAPSKIEEDVLFRNKQKRGIYGFVFLETRKTFFLLQPTEAPRQSFCSDQLLSPS